MERYNFMVTTESKKRILHLVRVHSFDFIWSIANGIVFPYYLSLERWDCSIMTIFSAITRKRQDTDNELVNINDIIAKLFMDLKYIDGMIEDIIDYDKDIAKFGFSYFKNTKENIKYIKKQVRTTLSDIIREHYCKNPDLIKFTGDFITWLHRVVINLGYNPIEGRYSKV